MSRKAFFAAFVIDEGSYASEPGPVDHHFVAADLAQSTFGEQSGVSNIVVWNSADDLVADHRQRGPITADHLAGERTGYRARFPHTPETCPSNHWNRGDDICADCGADLSASDSDQATARADGAPSFRDRLSSTLRNSPNIRRCGPASSAIVT